jgi:DNA-directed RNA polymerase specialized sigma subunit
MEEIKQALTDTIKNLSDREKIILNLYFFQELTVMEIVEITNFHSQSVIDVLAKIKKALREEFSPANVSR